MVSEPVVAGRSRVRIPMTSFGKHMYSRVQNMWKRKSPYGLTGFRLRGRVSVVVYDPRLNLSQQLELLGSTGS
ncbi:unnamed protein product [Linum trigynum]|uniref:Uncharacterized protein n=1 Tax=Linum trigynum TaxID=586398 RepID=A0AAV2G0A9_9ROSI